MSGSLATARPVRTTTSTGTHHSTAEASLGRARSIVAHQSHCRPRGVMDGRFPDIIPPAGESKTTEFPPEIPPRPRNVRRMDWSELDHCNSSRLFSSAHGCQTQSRRARSCYSGHQNQINLEVSDVHGMTNPPVLFQSGHGTPGRTVTAPSRNAGGRLVSTFPVGSPILVLMTKILALHDP